MGGAGCPLQPSLPAPSCFISPDCACVVYRYIPVARRGYRHTAHTTAPFTQTFNNRLYHSSYVQVDYVLSEATLESQVPSVFLLFSCPHHLLLHMGRGHAPRSSRSAKGPRQAGRLPSQPCPPSPSKRPISTQSPGPAPPPVAGLSFASEIQSRPC